MVKKVITNIGNWEIVTEEDGTLFDDRIILRNVTDGKMTIYSAPVENWSSLKDYTDEEEPNLIFTDLRSGNFFLQVRNDGVIDFSYLGNLTIFFIHVPKTLTRNLRLLMLEKAGVL